MCWKITCCRDFCGCAASTQVGGGGASIAATSHVGAVASAGHRAIEISGGNLSAVKSESLAVGGVLSANKEVTSSIGADGYSVGYEQNTQIGGLEMSVKEDLACCGEDVCCQYSISCCGADCGIASSDCANAVATVGEGCITGCSACFEGCVSFAGDAISSLRSFLCCVVELAEDVLDS